MRRAAWHRPRFAAPPNMKVWLRHCLNVLISCKYSIYIYFYSNVSTSVTIYEIFVVEMGIILTLIFWIKVKYRYVNQKRLCYFLLTGNGNVSTSVTIFQIFAVELGIILTSIVLIKVKCRYANRKRLYYFLLTGNGNVCHICYSYRNTKTLKPNQCVDIVNLVIDSILSTGLLLYTLH